MSAGHNNEKIMMKINTLLQKFTKEKRFDNSRFENCNFKMTLCYDKYP